MKLVKLFGVLVILCAIVITSFSCKAGSATTATPTTRTATVTKGTLTNSITGTGNLAYSTTEDLAFEIAGYVNNVLVSEGDTVKKGQELANLDTSDWEDQIKALTKTLTSAQRALADAQRALASKQRTLASKQDTLASLQRTVTNREFVLKQDQIDIESANYTLSLIEDVKNAQDNVDSAQLALDIAKANHEGTQMINARNEELKVSQDRLASVLATTNTNLKTSAALAITQAKQAVALKQKTLADDRQSVEDAKASVANAQLDINDAQLDIDDAQLNIADAQQNVTDAQANLDDARSKSPIISAPFDGYITSVKVKGGDEVFKGSVAMTIADPNQFQADIMVTENDIAIVKLDGEATVSLDALSDLTFPSKITWIAPTATVSSGVVNYKVTVTLTALKPILPTRQNAQGSSPAGGQASSAIPSGATRPSGFTSQTGSTAPSGFTPPSGTAPSRAANINNSDTTTQNVSLKQGLSATVTIISQQKENVLYVPSKAITRQGANQTVKVINGTVVETRTVKTGMTDGTSTEITEGLNEGEQLTYTTTSSSSSTNRGFGPGVMPRPPGGF